MAIDIKGTAPLLQVFDMPLSLSFYRGKLGFELVQSAGPEDDIGCVLLRWNGIELMLNTAYEKQDRPPLPDPVRIAAHSDTTIYFGCPDVDALYNHLRNNNVEIKKPEITQYGWKALHLSDPDGFGLCFHWPIT